MIIDARSIAAGEKIECDICIVGGGAAGTTLASEFCDQGMRVLLLESGGIRHDKQLDSLDQGEVSLDVHTPLEQYRRRQLGGATTFWGGRCVPFDKSDFEVRDHVPYSGWPITRTDLDPYYKRAHSYCEIGEYTYRAENALPETERHRSMIPEFQSSDISVENIYLFSPPTDFGKKHLEKLKKSNNVRTLIYANCLKLITDSEGHSIDHLEVASIRKNTFLVQAKHFILATGGLEVTRLMLLSNDFHANGIGNQNDLLGRFYMGHINHFFDVKFNLKEDIIWNYEKTKEGVYCQRQISIDEEKRLQNGLLNQRVYVERPDFTDPDHGNSILSAAYLAKGLISGKPKYDRPLQHAKNVIFDLENALKFSGMWIGERLFGQRKLPSVVAKGTSNVYKFRSDSEQAPNPNSRVSLSHEKDLFGSNRLKVDWRCSDIDKNSVQQSINLIDEAFSKSGIGKVLSSPDVNSFSQGGHYLGTARMASSPQKGVVDADCRVHGLSNLYVASSSVFATSSYANPTLTIVALAIRLADHLKMKYS
jgi:hypothetical protein